MKKYQKLKTELEQIAEKGIQVDSKHLKRDMCAQFANPREWIREYAVNAADAQARFCYVSGFGDEKTITIIVEDDGHGMDKQGALDFCSIYRSVKRGDPLKIVGRHGVGKLSPAAISGQCGFVMRTSTGKECWRMEAGCLLENTPIRLERIEPVPQQGTRFEITFENNEQIEPARELEKLADLLEQYMRYHPLTIVVFEMDGEDPESPKWAKPIRRISGHWTYETERLSRHFSFELNGLRYEVVMGMGSGEHELYQNCVLITKQYNLLSHDLLENVNIPYLKIRVNSPDFKMPFGRNCLNNEEVLGPLSGHIREEILPGYFDELYIAYEKDFLKEYSIIPKEVEAIACALMLYDPYRSDKSWCNIPVFAARNHLRLSLEDLRQIVRENGVLYLQEGANAGLDYSAFEAPVLSRKQPLGGLQLLEKLFKEELVVIGKDDVVLEATNEKESQLGPREKRFESYLGFHPEVLRMKKRRQSPTYSGKDTLKLSFEEIQRLSGVCEESISAKNDLSSLEWRVNFLVQKDGKTPCRTHRFLLKHNTVVLNLNCPEVEKLVLLSESAPKLAGHWALAMCFTEENKILPHLTPEAREDLVLLDAMAKLGFVGKQGDKQRERFEFDADRQRNDREFLLDIDDVDRWLD